jgi:hypothetical protein
MRPHATPISEPYGARLASIEAQLGSYPFADIIVANAGTWHAVLRIDWSAESGSPRAVTPREPQGCHSYSWLLALTTLLHELLSLDPGRCYPTTHACMNPHHFLLTEASTLARGGAGVKWPMDEMEVRPGSPQEDEFALLSLGARSPYQALIAPHRLAEVLKLADPRDLPAREEQAWRSALVDFLRGVSARGAGWPMILKSPLTAIV